PIGRYGGALADVRPDDMAAAVIAEAVARAGVPPDAIEDVWFGAANQAGEDNRNVARMAALLAGLPESVAGVTVNRLCASGLSAVIAACHAVAAGDGDLFVAGGVESMTRAPLAMPKPDRSFEHGHRTVYDTTLGWRYPNPRLEAMFPLESMGETGENVAAGWSVSRTDQDAFALRSQQRWAAAQEAGRFADELVPVADIDLVELNEAFASQSVAVVRELGLDPDRVNVNGGAIALGHPLGMSGARLVVSLVHELRRRGGRYGLATLCVGVGQGQAALFERPGSGPSGLTRPVDAAAKLGLAGRARPDGATIPSQAEVAELADAPDSKSGV